MAFPDSGAATVAAVAAYDPTMAYTAGDEVLYQGYSVIANADVPESTAFAWGAYEEASATWYPSQFGSVFKGAYDVGVTYALGDVVAANTVSTSLYASSAAANLANDLGNATKWTPASFTVSPSTSLFIVAYQANETYYLGQHVCYNGLIVTPNATVVAGTPFAFGTTGATFKLDVDATSQQYASKILGEYVYKGGLSEVNGLKYCNGQAISRSFYAKLDTECYVGDANNATANAFYRCTDPANPTTTRSNAGGYLVLPDMRGRVAGGAGQGVFTSTFASTDVLVAANDINVPSNRSIFTGTAVVLSTTGTAPGGLTAGTTYYAIRESATLIMLATTRANAVAGTAIDITSQGAGTHTLTITYTDRAVGNVAGEEDHTNTIPETPAHTHNFTNTYSIQYSSDAFNTNMSSTDEISRTETTAATGGSGAHNNMQPTAFVGYWFIYTGVIV